MRGSSALRPASLGTAALALSYFFTSPQIAVFTSADFRILASIDKVGSKNEEMKSRV